MQECVRPDVKQVKSALTGTILRLGDVEARPEEAIEVTVKMSKCTAIARPPSMKKFAKRLKEDAEEGQADDEGAEAEVEGLQDVYAQLQMQTEYVLPKVKSEEDDEQEDGAEDTRRTKSGEDDIVVLNTDDLVRGFKYGASYVPCPDGQFNRLSSQRGFDICGFFPDKHVGNLLYSMANNQLIDAYAPHSSVAIMLWVKSHMSGPILVPAHRSLPFPRSSRPC